MVSMYLDQQIIVSHEDDDAIIAAVRSLRAAGATFPYSPAHVEEIARAHQLERGLPLDGKMANLAQVSGGIAMMPTSDGPAEIRSEDPRLCLERVLRDRGRELTEDVVELERARYEAGDMSRPAGEWAAARRSVQKCTPDTVFSNAHVMAWIDNLARNLHFRRRTASFAERRDTIATLFDVLNMHGFQAEPRPHRTENRVHDVTHAIYATYADVFVSNDRKLRNTAKAVYLWCGLETEVIDRPEFLRRGDAAR